MTKTTAPILALTGISKQFAGVKALNNVSLRLYAGEVHTLMGQNGAGKSTLIKVLTGVYSPDQGVIDFDGNQIQPGSTQQAQELGISTVYQEVNLCPNLSVAENIFIGGYPRLFDNKFGPIDWKAMRHSARKLLLRLKIDIDVGQPLATYSLAIQQMVAIARALNRSAKVLILDEPTSSLDDTEVQLLFDVMRELRSQGMAILFVTHFLDQTYAISDRITVMRNGEREGEYLCRDLPRLTLVNKMVGQSETTDESPRNAPSVNPDVDLAAPFMQASGLGKKGSSNPFDLSIHPGEVLGFSGLLGSGRTEAARLLFGADKADSGHISIVGKRRTWNSPLDAIAHGIGFCSEDRKHEGAILSLSVRENMNLALQARAGIFKKIPLTVQRAATAKMVQLLGVKTADMETPIGNLSGGNQQKVLLARWLITQPSMLILDEPTRGIDVHAKQEILRYISTLSRSGMAVLLISSELSDVLNYSDRIIVFRDRKTCGEFKFGELSEHTMQQIIAGGSAE